MGFIYQGIPTATSFRNNSPTPLDGYSIVETRDDLNLPTNATPGIFENGLRYKGRQVFVMDEGQWYYLKSGITDADWTVLGGMHPNISTWGNEIEYEEGSLVWNSGMLYRAVDTHTSAEAPATIFDDNEHWENASADVYHNLTPTLNDVGGISAGSVFLNTTFSQYVERMHYPDVPPEVVITATPAFGLKEKGIAISNIVLHADITKTKYDIQGMYFRQDDTDIEPTGGIPNGGAVDSTVAISLTGLTDTTFGVYAYDNGTPNLSAEVSGNYTFVNPLYIGSVAAAVTAATITEADVKGLVKRISANNENQTLNLTGTDVRPVIAIPAGYGTLTSILDTNGFELLWSFSSASVSITTAANEVVPYQVFVLGNSTSQTNFNVTYKFS